MIEAIAYPLRREGAGTAFAEVGRRHGDYAIVACAAVVDGTRMRLAVGGVADRPTARDFPHLAGSALDDALNAASPGTSARGTISTAPPATAATSCGVSAAGCWRKRPGPQEATPIRRPCHATARREGPSHGGLHPQRARDHHVEVETRTLLTDALRHGLGATGTHVGCEHGVCGACTVSIDGVPARACLTLAVGVEGCAVRTVEGLAPEPGRLGVLQAAFRGGTPCNAASAPPAS